MYALSSGGSDHRIANIYFIVEYEEFRILSDTKHPKVKADMLPTRENIVGSIFPCKIDQLNFVIV
jgi:hypothetical protein